MLDRAAQLRSQALSHGDGGDEDARVGDYAVSTWVWLGRLFARLRPAFWQGRNRWLGGAAFPEVFNVQTNVMTVGATPPPAAPGPGVLLERFRGWLGSSARTTPTTLEEDVARMVAQTREATSQQSARARAPGLRELLESTATLTPVLAVPNWETSLPREGNGSCTSGAVQDARLDHLIAAARSLQATNTVPYQNGSEWVELVVAAALEAKRTGSHLVEGDDSIFGAYRWPAVDES